MERVHRKIKPNQIHNSLIQYSKEATLLFSGLLLFISMELLILATGLRRSLLIFEVLFFFPFFGYLLAIFLSKRFNAGSSKFQLLIVLFFAALMQVIILFTEISLSDDVYRFFLEGKAVVHGINPYTTSIDKLPPNIHDEYIDKVNHPSVTSPYPPVALILFAALYLVSSNPFTYRVAFSIGFIASIVVCSKLLSAEHKWKLVVYAWNPLLHLETANGSHFEPIVVLLVMIAVWGLDSGRVVTAGGFLLLAFLLKYYALFLVVIYWKRLGYRGLSIFMSGLVLYGIFVVLTPQALLGGILTYAETWYFNASVFWLLVQLLQNFLLAKILLGGLFTLLLGILAFRGNNEVNPSHITALMGVGLFLLLQPNFHPWYVFWVFPFVLLDKNLKFSWVLLTGMLIFSYHVYIAYDTTQLWVESDLIRLLEYLPFYTILALENRSTISKFY